MMAMVPGEYFIDEGEHALNPGRRTITLVVQNTADRPIQVEATFPDGTKLVTVHQPIT